MPRDINYVVLEFVKGRGAQDIANELLVHRRTVEACLRDAMKQFVQVAAGTAAESVEATVGQD